MNPLKEMKVTSPFGKRVAPIPGASTEHSGVDLKARYVETYAISDGKVVKVAEWAQGIGKYVIIDHGDYQTTYGHLSEFRVIVGQSIKEGELIAITGNSGNSQAPHLHFEVRSGKYDPLKYWSKNKDGFYDRAIDPIQYLESKESKLTDFEKQCKEANDWAKSNDISTCERLNDKATRQEVIIMLYKFYKLIVKLLKK